VELKLTPRISASAAKFAAGLLRSVLNSTVSTLRATVARIIHHDLIIRLCGSSVMVNSSTGLLLLGCTGRNGRLGNKRWVQCLHAIPRLVML
jgi:hypothetical protein